MRKLHKSGDLKGEKELIMQGARGTASANALCVRGTEKGQSFWGRVNEQVGSQREPRSEWG